MASHGGGTTPGLGTIAGIFGLATVIAYLVYKTGRHRKELRQTVNLLTKEKGAFVDDLQALFPA